MSVTQRLVLSGDIEENPGPIQDRKTAETPAVQRTKIKAKCPNCPDCPIKSQEIPVNSLL